MNAKRVDSDAPGAGLDIGTMNIVSARRKSSDGQTEIKKIRDAFLDLDPDAKRSLRMSRVNYVEKDGALIVIGDSALTMANLFKREARRPLSRGVISAGELDAQEILSLLTHHVLNDPIEPGEHCFYSVPSAPLDDPNQDVLYHTEVFRKILTEHGYTAHPANEAMAIIFSQCAKENFSGLAVSFGAGMINVALAYQAAQGMEFSLSRCLSEDFPVLTPDGVKPVVDIVPGEDHVLDAHGQWVEVLELVNNGTRDSLLEVCLENLPAMPVSLTPDHKVFVQERFGWTWKEARELAEGDVLGVPVIRSTQTSGNSYYFGRKNTTNVTVATARNLGRFFGMFLGDGSCGPYSENPEFVQLAMNRRDQHLVDKYVTVVQSLFGRFSELAGGMGVGVHNYPSEEVTRVKLHSTVISRHMKDKFYARGQKVCPLDPSRISDQMAIGIIEGLLDSDGHREPKRHTLTNTSLSVICLVHHLLNRFGIEHSIQSRDPRPGGLNKYGTRIEGRKICYEIRITGHVATLLLETIIQNEGHQVWNDFQNFMPYRVKHLRSVTYGKDVWDLKVCSDHHSFSSWGLVAHNCGDWVDSQSARAVGRTAAQMCAIKEQGVDLTKPKGREQEAIALYIRALIDYCLQNVAAQFKRVQNDVSLPTAVPFVVSGGTSLAEGFMNVFQQQFHAIKKKGFPIEISEVRAASNPMTAVAEGLLVLAIEEHEGD